MVYNETDILVYHFTHINNFPSILQQGLLADANISYDKYKNIGNIDIKNKRKEKPVPFGGYVADYVPFYFAPQSPMMYTQFINNIIKNTEIIYLVANLHSLRHKYTWCCSNMNAAKYDALFFNDIESLEKELSWDIFSKKEWKNTDQYPDRMQRRMAEFLIHERVLWNDFLGVAVYDEAAKSTVSDMMSKALNKPIAIRKKWYF